MPDDLRQPLLAAYARYGIDAYDAHDWDELERIAEVVIHAAPRERV